MNSQTLKIKKTNDMNINQFEMASFCVCLTCVCYSISIFLQFRLLFDGRRWWPYRWYGGNTVMGFVEYLRCDLLMQHAK